MQSNMKTDSVQIKEKKPSVLPLNRRNMLAGASASILALQACKTTAVKGVQGQAIVPSLLDEFSDMIAQIAGIRKGEIQASELLEASIKRLETLNPKIGAVLTPCYDRARDKLKNLPAQTLAMGTPMLIKDLKDVEGVRTTYGSGIFKSYVPEKTDIYARRLEQAGFSIFGKTNTPEFGLWPFTTPNAYMPARNPWDLTKTPGGSSGGAAAAVAAGILPCAQGSDGGGSIRIPAHYSGVFGLKTSRDRVVSQNKRPFSISVSGALSRSVRDSAYMLAVTEQSDTIRPYDGIGMVRPAKLSQLKIGYMTHDYMQGLNIMDADVDEVIAKTARLCENLGHVVIPTTPPYLIDSELREAFLLLWSWRTHQVITEWEGRLGRKVKDTEIEPWTQMLAQHFVDSDGDKNINFAIGKLMKSAKKINTFLGQFDVVLSPAMPFSAHKYDLYNTGDRAGFEKGIDTISKSVSYMAVYNVSGAPAMSVPLFRSSLSGMPVGSQFISVPGNDALLLRLAYQLEIANPWIDSYKDIRL